MDTPAAATTSGDSSKTLSCTPSPKIGDEVYLLSGETATIVKRIEPSMYQVLVTSGPEPGWRYAATRDVVAIRWSAPD